MVALPLSSEDERELAVLRARAYGPGADIETDADALARLTELEVMARSEALASAPAIALGADPSATDQATSPGAASVFEQTVDSAEPPAPIVPRWRRLPLWPFVAGAAALGLALGVVLPALLPPHPQAVLESAPFDGAPVDFEMYGLDAIAPTHYDAFHALEVWSSTTPEGAVCLLITTSSGEWVTAGCAAGALDPIADVVYYPDSRPIRGLDLPPGSVVRFILTQGAVEVWIDENVERT